MKVVLLAAGEGSRLRPFSTKKDPKIMLAFLGKPVLGYQIEEFIRAGLNDFIIICNPSNIDSIKAYATKAFPRNKFEFAIQKDQLGPSHAISMAKRFLEKEDFFIFKYTDNITSQDQAKEALKVFKPGDMQAVVTLKKVKHPSHYGIAKFDKAGMVIEIIEKPEPGTETSDLANTGTGILNTDLFFQGFEEDNLADNVKEVPPQEYVLRAGGKAGSWVYEHTSIDLGRPWNILEINHLLIDRYLGRRENFVSKNSKIGEGSKLDGYVSLNGVKVGKNCYLKNCYFMLGTVIEDDCHITDSVIGKNSVISSGFKTKVKSSESIEVWVKDKFMDTGYTKLGCFIGSNVKVAKNLVSSPGKIVYSDRVVSEDVVKDLI